MNTELENKQSTEEEEELNDLRVLNEQDDSEIEFDEDFWKEERDRFEKVKKRLLVVAGASLFVAAITTTVLVLTTRKSK